MNRTPIPCSACSRRRMPRISAWVVTSRAVVGSSQSSSSGSTVRAPAIITRWSMPPDSSCGCWRRWRSASSRPTARSSSTARAVALSLDQPWLSRRDSVRKSPTRRIGLMPARGSWKIIDTSERRRASSRSFEAPRTSQSPTRTEPSITGRSGHRPRTARAVNDLPEPDSPTSPTTSPLSTCNDTSSSTGRSARPGSRSDRPSISSSAISGPARRCGRRAPRRRC